MRFWFNGDGDGLEVHFHVDWKAAIALLKAVLATLVVLSALLAALAHLGT
jgi:hypothetical protein